MTNKKLICKLKMLFYTLLKDERIVNSNYLTAVMFPLSTPPKWKIRLDIFIKNLSYSLSSTADPFSFQYNTAKHVPNLFRIYFSLKLVFQFYYLPFLSLFIYFSFRLKCPQIWQINFSTKNYHKHQ